MVCWTPLGLGKMSHGYDLTAFLVNKLSLLYEMSSTHRCVFADVSQKMKHFPKCHFNTRVIFEHELTPILIWFGSIAELPFFIFKVDTL